MRTPALVLLAAASLAIGCGREPSDGGSGSSTGSGSSSGSTGASGTSGSSGGSSGSSIFQIIPCDDASSNPCGTAQLGFDAATALANPHNALSAGISVRSHGAAKLLVLYEDATGTLGGTPAYDATPDDPQLLPVLGLRPQTDYLMQVLATDGNHHYARSPILGFTTGALPSNAQESFSVASSGNYLPGFVMVSRISTSGAQAALPGIIVDRSGRVVWYSNTPSSLFGDFKKQPNDTYTLGVFAPPVNAVTFNVSYLQVDPLGDPLGLYSIPVLDGGPENLGTDNHEFTVLPDGDALLIGNTARTMDTTAYDGGSATEVVEQTLWRVHPDGGVAFLWDAFDHTSLDDLSRTFADPAADPLDATHLNAFSVTPDGNYLASFRHLSQVMKIDAQTGDVIWRLGENGDFTFINDPLNGFSGQHHAQEISDNDILLFDDGNEHQPPQSRAVEYRLDLQAKTATLVWSYEPSPLLFGFALGSVQRLANGNTLVNFGTASRIDEVDAEGNLVWQLVDEQPAFGFYRALFVDSLY